MLLPVCTASPPTSSALPSGTAQMMPHHGLPAPETRRHPGQPWILAARKAAAAVPVALLTLFSMARVACEVLRGDCVTPPPPHTHTHAPTRAPIQDPRPSSPIIYTCVVQSSHSRASQVCALCHTACNNDACNGASPPDVLWQLIADAKECIQHAALAAALRLCRYKQLHKPAKVSL